MNLDCGTKPDLTIAVNRLEASKQLRNSTMEEEYKRNETVLRWNFW